MKEKLEPKFKVGDKVYMTLGGTLNNLLYETKLLTIRKVDYDLIYPIYYFEEKRSYPLKEKDLTAFSEIIPKFEEHIEKCKTKLKELRHAHNTPSGGKK